MTKPTDTKRTTKQVVDDDYAIEQADRHDRQEAIAYFSKRHAARMASLRVSTQTDPQEL